jgi:hypothetical protein
LFDRWWRTRRSTQDSRGSSDGSATRGQPELARCSGFGANLPGELGLSRNHDVAFWLAASFYPVTPETPPQGLTTRVGVAEGNTMKHTSVRWTATLAVMSLYNHKRTLILAPRLDNIVADARTGHRFPVTSADDVVGATESLRRKGCNVTPPGGFPHVTTRDGSFAPFPHSRVAEFPSGRAPLAGGHWSPHPTSPPYPLSLGGR